MEKTSTAYQNEMAKQLRGQSHVRIDVGVIDIDAAEDAAVFSSAGTYYSKLDGLVFERIPAKTYATFEPGRWKCDGQQLVPSKKFPLEEGFVSGTLSGGDGYYSTIPFVRFNFSKRHTSPALTFVFDASCNDYPSEIRIKIYRENNIICDEAAFPKESSFIFRNRLSNFDKIELFFVRSNKPFRRARLQHIIFGMGIIFTNADITAASLCHENDPINRRLPNSELDFTVLNYSGAYDLDNPEGIWRDMEKQTPLKIEFGQQLTSGLTWNGLHASKWSDAELNTWGAVYEGGFVEYVNAGQFYLTSSPVAHKNEVNFKAVDILGLMTNSYYKGNWNKSNLLELALDVLKDAKLPPRADGTSPWKLWDGLAGFSLELPAPILPGREILQLIAHSAMCVFYVDREGFIRIEPAPKEQHKFFLDFETLSDMPDIDKTPVLAGVKTSAVKFVPEYNNSTYKEIHKGEYYIKGEETLHIEFGEPAKNIKVSVSNGTCTATTYARSADILVKCNGYTELVITGIKMVESKSIVYAPAKEEDENAEWEEVENPLISTVEHAALLAGFIKEHLLMRSNYSLEYRGNPELDILDNIYLQSRFTKKFPAYILKHKIKFNGALKGEILAKKLEN